MPSGGPPGVLVAPPEPEPRGPHTHELIEKFTRLAKTHRNIFDQEGGYITKLIANSKEFWRTAAAAKASRAEQGATAVEEADDSEEEGEGEGGSPAKRARVAVAGE